VRQIAVVQEISEKIAAFRRLLDVVAVANGGSNTLENLVTACVLCNSMKHQRLVGDFLAERNF